MNEHGSTPLGVFHVPLPNSVNSCPLPREQRVHRTGPDWTAHLDANVIAAPSSEGGGLKAGDQAIGGIRLSRHLQLFCRILRDEMFDVRSAIGVRL